MIKAIIFDFYGVICSEIGAEWYKNTAPQEKVSQLKEIYDQPSDLGIISEEEFFSGIAASIDATGEEVRQDWIERAAINSDVISLARELKEEYKIAICSNSAPEIFRELVDRNQLRKLFDTLVVSGELGVAKPNPKIFKYTLDQLNISPKEAVFIDDNPINTEAAKGFGINAILFTGVESMKKGLDTLLKSVDQP